MTLKDAKVLRDEITATTGAWCTVPLGYKPDRYFCRIFRSLMTDGHFTPPANVDFHSREEWLVDLKEQQKRKAEQEAMRNYRPPRNALEAMIDAATGYDKLAIQ